MLHLRYRVNWIVILSILSVYGNATFAVDLTRRRFLQAACATALAPNPTVSAQQAHRPFQFTESLAKYRAFRRAEPAGTYWQNSHPPLGKSRTDPIIDVAKRLLKSEDEEGAALLKEIEALSKTDERVNTELAQAFVDRVRSATEKKDPLSAKTSIFFDLFKSEFEQLEVDLAREFGLSGSEIFSSIDLILSGDALPIAEVILERDSKTVYSKQFLNAVIEGVSRFAPEYARYLRFINTQRDYLLITHEGLWYLETVLMDLLQLGYDASRFSSKSLKFRFLDEFGETLYLDEDLTFITKEYQTTIQHLNEWINLLSKQNKATEFHGLLYESAVRLQSRLTREITLLPELWQSVDRKRVVRLMNGRQRSRKINRRTQIDSRIDLDMVNYRIQSEAYTNTISFTGDAVLDAKKQDRREVKKWIAKNIRSLAIVEAEVALDLGIPHEELFESINHIYHNENLLGAYLKPKPGDTSLKNYNQTLIDRIVEKVKKFDQTTGEALDAQTSDLSYMDESIRRELSIYKLGYASQLKYSLISSPTHDNHWGERVVDMIAHHPIGRKELAEISEAYNSAISRVDSALKNTLSQPKTRIRDRIVELLDFHRRELTTELGEFIPRAKNYLTLRQKRHPNFPFIRPLDIRSARSALAALVKLEKMTRPLSQEQKQLTFNPAQTVDLPSDSNKREATLVKSRQRNQMQNQNNWLIYLFIITLAVETHAVSLSRRLFLQGSCASLLSANSIPATFPAASKPTFEFTEGLSKLRTVHRWNAAHVNLYRFYVGDGSDYIPTFDLANKLLDRNIPEQKELADELSQFSVAKLKADRPEQARLLQKIRKVNPNIVYNFKNNNPVLFITFQKEFDQLEKSLAENLISILANFSMPLILF